MDAADRWLVAWLSFAALVAFALALFCSGCVAVDALAECRRMTKPCGHTAEEHQRMREAYRARLDAEAEAWR